MKRLALACGAALLALSGAASADIVYTGTRSAGTATASLSITTDGTLGVLATSNILDWKIVLSDGADTFSLFGPASGNNSSVLIYGSALSATASSLMFDFGAASGFALFQAPNIGSGRDFYCAQITGCFDSSGAAEGIDAHTDFSYQRVAQQGSVVLASSQETSQVPEPASLALLGIGLAGLAGARRRTAN